MESLIETLTNTVPDSPYQILDQAGNLVAEAPDIAPGRMIELYRGMWTTRLFSDKIVALQRQGRSTTFGPLAGQEAAAVGVGAPLLPQDWITGSYREVGAYLIKGVGLKSFINTFRGYPPTKEFAYTHNCLPLQIVIATQMLHAVGLAMAAKIKGDDAVGVGICGDGATSEGDFNEALNFAGVNKAPTIIVVTNNGWAISVPRQRQSAAKNFASRGVGFGVPAYLVDGNDILAVYKMTQEAAARARAGDGPTLLELITYRMGAHTTADDPTRYRPKEELDYWRDRDPITRFKIYLLKRDILGEADDARIQEEIETEINEAVRYVENSPVQAPDSIFDITFEKPTGRMERQRALMRKEMQEGGQR